mmetsp:Transcript_15321/g.13045  ORF Transcript_15321/g.13045 Transcript_15321/m.13045 type:complete len:258 (+) Transcript_15321:913-1686(+)
MERFCVLTRYEFRYYKTSWHAQCPDIKPLYSVPIDEILAIFRVNLHLPQLKTKKNYMLSDKKSYKELYQFEIFNNLTDYPYYREVLEKDQQPEEENKQDFENSEVEKRPEFDVEKLDGYRMWNDYEENRRSKFNSPSKSKEGHLMRVPLNQRTFRSSFDGKSKDGMGTAQKSRFGDSYHQSPSPEVSPQKLKRDSPLKGAVYKWVKQISDLTSWTNREKEWFYAEKRLLFAAPKLSDREKWLSVLNWIVNETHQGGR